MAKYSLVKIFQSTSVKFSFIQLFAHFLLFTGIYLVYKTVKFVATVFHVRKKIISTSHYSGWLLTQRVKVVELKKVIFQSKKRSFTHISFNTNNKKQNKSTVSNNVYLYLCIFIKNQNQVDYFNFCSKILKKLSRDYNLMIINF